VELASSVQGSKHRATCDMVERAYGIHRKDGGAWAFRVGLEALAPCSGRDRASRLHVGARVGFAAFGEGGNDGGVKHKL